MRSRRRCGRTPPARRLPFIREQAGGFAMRPRTTIAVTAMGLVLVAAAAVAAASGGPPASVGTPHVHTWHTHAATGGHPTKHGGTLQERFLYVSTVAQSKTDPDFIAVIGADPRRADY